MKLSKIKITPEFAATTPAEWKIRRSRYCFDRTGRIDKEIVVNRNSELVDGYIGYLVLLENDIKRYKVIKLKENDLLWRELFYG